MEAYCLYCVRDRSELKQLGSLRGELSLLVCPSCWTPYWAKKAVAWDSEEGWTYFVPAGFEVVIAIWPHLKERDEELYRKMLLERS